MFKNLMLLILATANINQTTAAEKLQYNSVAAFQSAIKNKDVKLSVVAAICKLCNCDLIIKNSNGVTISVLDYIQQHGGADHPGSE